MDKTPKQREKQTQILEAARELLAAKGPREVTAANLAKHLGWKTPGLYYYFDDLHSIFEAVLSQLIQENLAVSYRALEAASSGKQGLVDVFSCRIHHNFQHPKDFEFIWHHSSPKPLSPEFLKSNIYSPVQGFNDLLEARLAEDQNAGLINPRLELRALINVMDCLAQGICGTYLHVEKSQGKMRYPVDQLIVEGQKTLCAALGL